MIAGYLKNVAKVWRSLNKGEEPDPEIIKKTVGTRGTDIVHINKILDDNIKDGQVHTEISRKKGA